MTCARVLVLGGTAEARELAETLHSAGITFTSSLAGRVSQPRLPVGEVRIGGFGGVTGLIEALRASQFTHVVDATHPFAVGMRAHAVEATKALNIPMIRLARPGWASRPDASTWRWVNSYTEADTVAAQLGERPFLSSGRQTLPYFRELQHRRALVRVVEQPEPGTLPLGWSLILDRGPFTVPGEQELMRQYGVDVLVTKDSGGQYTAAKLDAAMTLGIPIVVVSRPAAPPGLAEVSSSAEVHDWLEKSVRLT